MSVTQADSELPEHVQSKNQPVDFLDGLFLWALFFAIRGIALRIALTQHRAAFRGVVPPVTSSDGHADPLAV